MNKSKLSFLTLIIVILFLSAITIYLLFNFNQNKIVVVDSNRLLENYEGFKEAQDLFEIKIESFNESFKSQNSIFEQKSKSFHNENANWSESMRSEKEKELNHIKTTLIQLKNAIDQKSSEEEKKLLEGIYNRVNDFVKRYSEKNDYDLVVGTNGTGNVVFNSPDIDKTDELIELLNKEYKNGIE